MANAVAAMGTIAFHTAIQCAPSMFDPLLGSLYRYDVSGENDKLEIYMKKLSKK